MSSGQHGGRFDFHDSVRVHEPPHLQERHRGEVPSHEAAVHLTERLQARDIRLPVRDIDGQSADLLGPASGRAHDLQHPLERAGPLLDEPGALGRGLSGDEQYPPAGRGEHAVIPAARSAERVGIDDAEGHRWEPATAITTASPLVSLPAPWHSASTALATSSGGISRRWPVVSSAARRASAGDIPVFAAMRLTDCRVISVSTYPGQTALTVTPVPATVNAVCPGYVDTEMTRQSVSRIAAKTGMSPADALRAALDTTGQRRLIPPEEVASAVLALCHGAGSETNGEAVVIAEAGSHR